MIEVEELFSDLSCKTRIWVSQDVVDAIADYSRRDRKKGEALLKRLRRYAENGFALFEGANEPIRHEWEGVYRIGHPVDLFRILGFYECERAEFIAIDTMTKRGQKLSAAERRRIDAVAEIRKKRLWRKKATHGDYPRLAQDS